MRTVVLSGGLMLIAWTTSGHADVKAPLRVTGTPDTTSAKQTRPVTATGTLAPDSSAATGHADTPVRVAAAGQPDATSPDGGPEQENAPSSAFTGGDTPTRTIVGPWRPVPPPSGWHLDVRVGGALDHAAAGLTAGVGRDLERFTVGAVLEWNPWFSIDTRRGSLGAFNAYATLSRRWYSGPCFSLYSRAEVGASTILFELVGVNRYSTGLYLAGSLLGVRARLSERTSITFDPSHVVMPMPQLTGFPFYYRQYRITVGIEVAL